MLQESRRASQLSPSATRLSEAGSTAAQELAFTLADGFGYVELGLSRGLDIETFTPGRPMPPGLEVLVPQLREQFEAFHARTAASTTSPYITLFAKAMALERAFAIDPFNLWHKNTLDLLDQLGHGYLGVEQPDTGRTGRVDPGQGQTHQPGQRAVDVAQLRLAPGRLEPPGSSAG